MPLWNYAFNQGGPDPDYVYSTTEVDPHGVYRISGFRGTSRFVEITQQSFDMMTSLGARRAAAARSTRHPRPRRPRPSTTTATSAWSSAAERPAGHDGDWWELDPQAGGC